METDNRLHLSEQQLDRLADRVAIRLAAARPQVKPMLTVEDICTTFQVSRAWVYENAGLLGGFKLGSGRRAPLRFDSDRVRAMLKPLAPPMQENRKDTSTVAQASERTRPRHLHPVYDG